MFPLRPSATSTTLYPLCGPLEPFCLLFCRLSPLQPLSALWPSVPSKVLCPLYGRLTPSYIQPSVPSMAFCPFYLSVPSAPST